MMIRTSTAIAVLLLFFSQNALANALLSHHIWRLPKELLGGFSAIHVDDDGIHFTMLSDRAQYVSGIFERGPEGAINGVAQLRHGKLRSSKGRDLWSNHVDAEGIAVAPSGGFYISFESNHRVMYHPKLAAPGQHINRHPDFRNLQNNSGLEALASDGAGRLYAIPERSGKLERPFPIYRYARGKWVEWAKLPRRGDFLVVGADIDAAGRLYILERDFSFPWGFATRLRRFDLGEGVLTGEEELFESRLGQYDNLEGLSVWQRGDGKWIASMVSDDNQNPFQRTEFVELVLPD